MRVLAKNVTIKQMESLGTPHGYERSLWSREPLGPPQSGREGEKIPVGPIYEEIEAILVAIGNVQGRLIPKAEQNVAGGSAAARIAVDAREVDSRDAAKSAVGSEVSTSRHMAPIDPTRLSRKVVMEMAGQRFKSVDEVIGMNAEIIQMIENAPKEGIRFNSFTDRNSIEIAIDLYIDHLVNFLEDWKRPHGTDEPFFDSQKKELKAFIATVEKLCEKFASVRKCISDMQRQIWFLKQGLDARTRG